MAEEQRPGQKLINYIRFIKDSSFYCTDDFGFIKVSPGETYLWNMSFKEFNEVINSSWEDLVRKYGVPAKYRECGFE